MEQNLPLIHILYKDFENRLKGQETDPNSIELAINKIREPG